MKSAPADGSPAASRSEWRRRLIERRREFAAGPDAAEAAAALTRHLREVLMQLEPECLGLYWPHRSEFNAALALLGDPPGSVQVIDSALALPFAQRDPVRMHYRAWDGAAPTEVDGVGIPSSAGAPVVPDVVLVPCVGYTASGLRLGYGGGYFDRWLAGHAGITSIGVAWSLAEIAADELAAESHDIALTLIVTEHGVV